MASDIPGKCCTVGTIHEGIPKGSLLKISGGIEAYLATPPSGNNVNQDRGLIVVPDIVGIWQNSKLLADAFASEGYTSLVLDIFNGDPAPLNMPDEFDIMGWLANGSDGKNPHGTEAIDPIILAGIEYLKNLGLSKIGAVGYCLGAKYVVRHFKSGIQCGFIAHPSFVETGELLDITGPLSIAAAEIDDIFPIQKRHESEEILRRTGQEYQITLFSRVEHGFAIRGDPASKVQRFAKEQAFHQAVAWFQYQFTKE